MSSKAVTSFRLSSSLRQQLSTSIQIVGQTSCTESKMVQSKLVRATATSHVFKLSMRAVLCCSSELSVNGFWRGEINIKQRLDQWLVNYHFIYLGLMCEYTLFWHCSICQGCSGCSDILTRTSPRSFLQTCSLPTGRKESEKTLSWGCRRSRPAGGSKHMTNSRIPLKICHAACKHLSAARDKTRCVRSQVSSDKRYWIYITGRKCFSLLSAGTGEIFRSVLHLVLI